MSTTTTHRQSESAAAAALLTEPEKKAVDQIHERHSNRQPQRSKFIARLLSTPMVIM